MTILVFFFSVVCSLRPIFPAQVKHWMDPALIPYGWGLFSEGEEVSFWVFFWWKKNWTQRKLLQVIVVERGTEDEKVEEMEPPVVRLHYICSQNMITICNSENGCWLLLLHILSCWCCLERQRHWCHVEVNLFLFLCQYCRPSPDRQDDPGSQVAVTGILVKPGHLVHMVEGGEQARL